MTPTTDLETALLDAHYQGDPVARFAWLGWCEDNGVKLTEAGITGVWRGTLADWLEVGPGLVRRVALERVEFSEREPKKHDLWWWYKYKTIPMLAESWRNLPGENDLPTEWFPEFKGSLSVNYDTRQDAIDDASRRAVRWARGQGQREEVSRGTG